MRIYVLPDEVTAARLWVFSTLTVSPGESLTIRRFLGAMNCGYEGYLCRRVMVSALPDGLIDVDVLAIDGQDVGILNRSDPLNFPSQRQVTVSGGKVWIYAGAAQPILAVRGVFDQRGDSERTSPLMNGADASLSSKSQERLPWRKDIVGAQLGSPCRSLS